jgi:hypothetical protein
MASSEISLLDDTLIHLAASGASGDEIELKTGIPAAQAIDHVKQLMKKRDIWTEVEQRQLLLFELNELKDSLRMNAVQMQDPEAGRLMLKTLELIGKRLDSEKGKVTDQVLRLSEFQQKILLRAMDAALNFAKQELAERYPEVPRHELDELVAEGLFRAKAEIENDR